MTLYLPGQYLQSSCTDGIRVKNSNQYFVNPSYKIPLTLQRIQSSCSSGLLYGSTSDRTIFSILLHKWKSEKHYSVFLRIQRTQAVEDFNLMQRLSEQYLRFSHSVGREVENTKSSLIRPRESPLHVSGFRLGTFEIFNMRQYLLDS